MLWSDSSTDVLKQGLIDLLGSKSLKHVDLTGLVLPFSQDRARLTMAVAEAILSSSTKFCSFGFPYPCSLVELLPCFWKMVKGICQEYNHSWVKLSNVFGDLWFPSTTADNLLLFNICRELTRVFFDIDFRSTMTTDVVKDFVVAYLQKYSNSDGDQRQLTAIIANQELKGSNFGNLPDIVTDYMVCDVVKSQLVGFLIA